MSLQHFVLKAKCTDKTIAPGLEVSALVEYETKEAIEHSDRIVLTVDDDVIEIPLKA